MVLLPLSTRFAYNRHPLSGDSIKELFLFFQLGTTTYERLNQHTEAAFLSRYNYMYVIVITGAKKI